MAKKVAVGLGLPPIVIGHFAFVSTGVEIHGRPDFEDYTGALAFAQRAHRCSGWWLADILRYGDTRADWRERLDQAIDSTGLSEKTLQNVRAIGAIPKSRRREGVEFALHGEVAGLQPSEQEAWLERAEVGGMTRSELRAAIKAAARTTILSGQAETLHTVEVTVRIVVEAASSWQAQEAAWALLKMAIRGVPHAHVVGARALRGDSDRDVPTPPSVPAEEEVPF